MKNNSAMDSKPKYVLLFFMAYSTFIMGAGISVVATTLPDLKLHFRTGPVTMSGLFIARGVGGILGCFITTFILTKSNVYLLLTASMIIYGIGMPLFAATSMISVAFVSSVLTGLASAVVITSALHSGTVLFPEKQYPFQIIATCFAIGRVLSPISAIPFRAKHVMETYAVLETTTCSNEEFGSTRNSSILHSDSFASINKDPLVTYLYIIFGSMATPTAIAFFLFYIQSRSNPELLIEAQYQQYKDLDEKPPVNKVCFVFLLVFMFPTGYGITYIHGNYISLIAQESHLNLSLNQATLIVIAFWLSCLFGRLTCTCLIVLTNPTLVVYVCLVCALASYFILVSSMYLSPQMYFWLGTISLGVFSNVQYPTFLGWCRYYVTLTPLVIALCTVGDYMGLTTLPFIGGQLYCQFGYIGIEYFGATLALVQLGIFSSIHCIGRYVL